ncbi:heparan sulfate 2-O-sulfotransferase 1-like isoform X1 [Leptopilina heterotoma]|uniref:heparan sulfate 2-O-sulfotransferase 1-like isoform X1 n=1 Tax=Leptopilina heterotoma TaxID=63436 RepID=UPI001CA869C3|nr:heparan sulfate 2-O-sulfotransferase 1-like isoform X1 [Leptopilina heterotoma]
MRRCRGVLTGLIGCLTVAFIVFSTRSFTDDQDLFDKESKDTTNTSEDYANQAKEQIAKNKQTQKHVTPSLAELGGRGTLPEMNDHVLMVTRIPGAGSELLVLILQRLQGYNAFKHIRLPPGDDGILTNLQQELLVEEITSIIKQEAVPLSFDGDVRFLNFSSFDRQAPTFISLVRDPLDPRTLDRFRNGDSSMIYSGSVAHFCGQDIRCTQRNSKWALERAKANAIRWYPVIGVLDLMDETLQVLESSYPQFFEGAELVYKNLRPKNISSEAKSLKNSVKKRLGKILAKEVEFYEWLKSRLLKKTSSNG